MHFALKKTRKTFLQPWHTYPDYTRMAGTLCANTFEKNDEEIKKKKKKKTGKKILQKKINQCFFLYSH